MKCEECGKELKAISNTHLTKCCGLTPEEYKDKYKLKYVCDESTRLKSVGENNPNYKDGNTYISVQCTSCGKNITGRGKSTLCTNCSTSGELNHFYGKHHSKTAREKMCKAHEFRDKSTYKYQKEWPNIGKHFHQKIKLLNWHHSLQQDIYIAEKIKTPK